jgi:hypothetical protein
MRLADDEIAVTVGREVIYLRPTLRAAMRLERRHGGFDKIVLAIADENLTVMADVIRESATEPTSIPGLLESIGLKPLRIGIEALVGPLTDLVFALAGVDPTDTSEKADTGPRITFAEHHERLFSIGTGWLGWSPETTWDATAAEISAAFHGRREMLRSVFGGNPSDSTPSDERDEAGFAVLKMMTATGNNRAH